MTQGRDNKVAIISLGCPRNLVDSELLLGMLQKEGYEIVDIKDARIGIVNTCAFIDEAKKESIDTILELIELKKAKKLSAVVVAGCLPQRYKAALPKGLPEVDAFLGCDEVVKIGSILGRIGKGAAVVDVSARPSFIYSHKQPRVFITPSHYVYVKISEGCGHACSFCVIPSIKGAYRSRPAESILVEIKSILERMRVSEINLVGQDTTLYGKDLYGKPAIGGLLKEICGLAADKAWVRLLYTHPSNIDDRILDVFACERPLCKYIDIPLQHVNDGILKRMNRYMSKSDILSLIARIRDRIPGVVLRSSFIVGFPGETEDEFEELASFIRQARFDRLGVFTYSAEEGTPAYSFKDRISEEVKLKRFKTLMSVQQDIACGINRSFLGRTVKALIDEKDENSEGVYIGRTQGDAPEVDGQVFVTGRGLKPGDFVDVKITDTLEYDLAGEAV